MQDEISDTGLFNTRFVPVMKTNWAQVISQMMEIQNKNKYPLIVFMNIKNSFITPKTCRESMQFIVFRDTYFIRKEFTFIEVAILISFEVTKLHKIHKFIPI